MGGFASIGESDSGTSRYSLPVGSPNTPGIWVLALSPLLYYAMAAIAITMSGATQSVMGLSISVVALIVDVVAVTRDHAVLKQRRLPAASPFWLLLSIYGYFIARRVVLKRGGVVHNAPSNVLVLAIFVGGIPLGIITATTLQERSSLAAVQSLETEIQRQLNDETDLVWTADCPDETDVSTAGVVMDCTASNSDGATVAFTATTTAAYTFEITVPAE